MTARMQVAFRDVRLVSDPQVQIPFLVFFRIAAL